MAACNRELSRQLPPPEGTTRARALRRISDEPDVASHRCGDYVLSGVVACGRCGGAYVASSGTGRDGRVRRYYSCLTSKKHGLSTCDGPNLPADELERVVAEPSKVSTEPG